jgi:protein gp37
VDCQARVANAEKSFRKVKAGVKWLSIEPLIEPLKFTDIGAFQWLVIGGASRSSLTPEWHPPARWVSDIESAAAKAGVPFYEKDNLRGRVRQYPGDVPHVDPTTAPEALRYLPGAS